jgi:polysaccharide biosynthesis/export protein
MIKLNLSLPNVYRTLMVGICIAGLLVLSSCGTTRRYNYLKNIQSDTTISGLVTNDFESKIQKGDQLSIVVTSLSSEEDAQFNKAAAVSSSPNMSGFTVNPDGTVLLHRLGKVTAAGLTRRELQAKLQQALLGYMKEPIVNVGYLNHKVTVIGAVGKSQVFPMPEEQMNIFDVLVNSGDINPEGKKDQVMVIREEGNTKKVKHLNLEDKSIFTSPWYYIKPNDIILVKADTDKEDRLEKRSRTQTTIAMVTGAASFLLIIVDRLTR